MGTQEKSEKRPRTLDTTFYVGPELEFFYFKNSEPKVEGLDNGWIFRISHPLDFATELRR